MKFLHSTLLLLFVSLTFYSCLHNRGAGQVPRANLRFTNSDSTVTIPFTRYRGWIIIKVSVNGTKERRFILDTGAPIAVLADAALQSDLHLNIIGNAGVAGADPNYSKSVPLAGNVTFTIGNVIIEDGLMAVGASSEAIDGVDGVIGKYLFDDAIVSINWEQSKLILSRPENFRYRGQGAVIPLQMLPSGHLSTAITIEKNGRTVDAKSDIDLGNRSNFFVDKQTASVFNQPGNRLSGIILFWGANGPMSGDIIRTDVKLGTIFLRDVITAIGSSNQAIKDDGLTANIGLSILERFNLVFDYHDNQLILEKNTGTKTNFPFTRSGIVINPKKAADYVLVADVVPGSSANKSNIVKGDKLTAIDDEKIINLTMDQIDSLLRGDDSQTLKLNISRDGMDKTAVLQLGDLI